MMRRLLICLLSSISYARAQAPLVQPSTRVFTVTTPATFGVLPIVAAGSVLIFRNGLFQIPGVNYTLTTTATGSMWQYKAGVLQKGDTIAVVTLPPQPGNGGVFADTSSPSGAQLMQGTYVIYRALTAGYAAAGTGCFAGAGMWSVDAVSMHICAPAAAGASQWTTLPMFFVHGEAPAAGAMPGTWTLANAPAFGVSCFDNGAFQPQANYTLAGSVLTSAVWQATDVILCDYEY